MNAEMTITQWHVPVDDRGCYWYSIFTSFTTPVDKKTMREQRLKTYPAPDYKPVHNRANGWGFDAEQQRKATYTGMGFDSTSTTSSPASRRGRSRIAPGKTSAAATKGLFFTAAFCSMQSTGIPVGKRHS